MQFFTLQTAVSDIERIATYNLLLLFYTSFGGMEEHTSIPGR